MNRFRFYFITLCGVLAATAARAQYSANLKTNTINGVVSNWVGNGTYVVGSNTFKDVLQIITGGVLSNGTGYLGYETSGSNNVAIVNGGAWSNRSELYVGYSGAGNQLIVTNGGTVFNLINGRLGYNSSSSNNMAVVSGPGSVWVEDETLSVGWSGAGNNLVINNQGKALSSSAELGFNSSSSNNVVVVSGPGSVLNYANGLLVGASSAGNSMVISNGGLVEGDYGYVGNGGNGNSVRISGSGSVWSNWIELAVGNGGAGNSLVISNGGLADNNYGYVGYSRGASNNNVLVTGPGSAWVNYQLLYVGYGDSSNALTIAGGSVLAVNAIISYAAGCASNAIRVASGSLIVTNAAGTSALVVSLGGAGTASFILNGGLVTVDALIATNGANSVVTFNGGLLESAGTSVTNAQQFVVGDGASGATFRLLGGVHSFNNGLRIRSNAALTGCGTINGSVVVDPGGAVLADCGGTLTFNGSVTNNGIMRITNGSALESYGTLVNNGTIEIQYGTTNFHAGFINNGVVVTSFQIDVIEQENANVLVIWTTEAGKTNELEATDGGAGGSYNTNNFSAIFAVTNTVSTVASYLDIGGATNFPARYYRVRLVP